MSRALCKSVSWLFKVLTLCCLVTTWDRSRSILAASADATSLRSGNNMASTWLSGTTSPFSSSLPSTRLASKAREKEPNRLAETMRFNKTLPRLTSERATTRSERARLISHFRYVISCAAKPHEGSEPLRCCMRTISMCVPKRKCALAFPFSSKRGRPPSSNFRRPRNDAAVRRRMTVAGTSLIEKAVRKLSLPASMRDSKSCVQRWSCSSSTSNSDSDPSLALPFLPHLPRLRLDP
mmetsp:Transcript_122207/g.351038  ORF Transcript_122207/g.351038 Transcript_122207/m.351038 type:complete len:237 (-) Transcript_122207:583-1293(-)